MRFARGCRIARFRWNAAIDGRADLQYRAETSGAKPTWRSIEDRQGDPVVLLSDKGHCFTAGNAESAEEEKDKCSTMKSVGRLLMRQ